MLERGFIPRLGSRPLPLPGLAESWESNLARHVSLASSPPFIGAAMGLLTAYFLSTPVAWISAGMFIALVIVLPVLGLLLLRRLGKIADLEIMERRQRYLPFLFALTGAGTAWAVLGAGHAPSPFVLLAGATASQLALLLIVTFRWKISVHCAAMGGAAVAIYAFTAAAFIPALGLTIVMWSRVRLERHTLGQSIAGALLGGAVFAAVFFHGAFVVR